MIDHHFFDWYNAYFEVQFQLQKLVDGAGYAAANMISVINGSHSLINHLMIKSAGKKLYMILIIYIKLLSSKIYWNLVMVIQDQ